MKIVLASASPRRAEILEKCGFDFCVKVSDVEEIVPNELTPSQIVMHLAKIKAQAVESEKDEIVLAADTIVVLEGNILGKPKDNDDAFKMLKSLSGKIHKVYTGVCLINNEREKVFFDSTEVEFYDFNDEEILDYVKTGEPLDKAGAYGIQEKGALLVKRINGDYFNVMGLPIGKVNQKLKDFEKTIHF